MTGRGNRSWDSGRGAALLAALLAAAPTTLPAQGVDRVLAREYFAEAERVGGSAATALWGGSLYGPLLFVDGGSREVVANQADPAGNLRAADGGVWVGTWPADQGVYNGSVQFGGRNWTMLAWPLPLGRYQRRVLLAHELFHRLQTDRGWPAGNPPNSHLDQEAGRTWLRLEWRALQEALARAGEDRRNAIHDALAFRAERRRIFPAGGAEERLLELNEGLAEYTGVTLALPQDARSGWVVRQLDNYDVTAARSSIVRNFAYASGPAYGVLLDARSSSWRAQASGGSDLGDLLADTYRLPRNPTADSAELRRRSDRYDGPRLFADEAERGVKRAAEQAAYHERFVTGPTLTLPGSDSLSYTFDPNQVVPFDAGGTVYLTTTVHDKWGTLTVTAGGAWFNRASGKAATVVVPAPADQTARPLHGPGWELELAAGWQLAPGEQAGSLTVIRSP